MGNAMGMRLKITPAKLCGRIRVPASKSILHRQLLCAAFAEGESILRFGGMLSEDIQATVRCLRMLGAEIRPARDTIRIQGGIHAPSGEMDCGESGSTLRFLIPPALVAAEGAPVCFSGRGRLMERPLLPYFRLFEEKGVRWDRRDGRLTLAGQLPAGSYALSGAVSSQFVSGLLFGLALYDAASQIEITDRLESEGYVQLTLCELRRAGISVTQEGNRFLLAGGKFQPISAETEGDWSQAAFFLGANFLGAEISLRGLRTDSAQGDRAVGQILAQMQQPGSLTIPAEQIPDLVPALAVAAAGRNGSTVTFTGVRRLRFKESDRLASISALIQALGGKARTGEDFLEISGTGGLLGGVVDCAGDHRIAMAAAEASVNCRNEIILQGADCVKKSYPAFWEDFAQLGGKTEVQE